MMTRLYNNPADFADEMIEGFAAANSRWVRRVPGGVARRVPPPPSTVAVVIGGGSGHYPAFGGLVGSGMAHGAVLGNVFASPSAQQVYDVAVNCETGAGVLLSYGNYAGDVLNFDEAQSRLIAEGIPCRTVAVTDDVSSAKRNEIGKRRGTAGDLAVFKVAGAAADSGRPLAEVARLAQRANDRCRSLGVAFGGCTLPGADKPLFDVPAGRMAVGMGVHGEPGMREQGMPSADELAELLVMALLNELPDAVPDPRGMRAVALLNGLGTIKYEELFVVYRRVAELLSQAGVAVVYPEVGELITSLDMAGASLTLFWLDEELEQLWMAPASSPGFCQTVAESEPVPPVESERKGRGAPAVIAASSEESRRAAGMVVAAARAVLLSMQAHAAELGRLDAVAGDGDHGIGMERGARAAAEAAEAALAQGAGVQTTLRQAAEGWALRAGGASGALWRTMLRALADNLSDEAAPTITQITAGLTAAVSEVQRVGGARLRDKTLVDALHPLAATLDQAIKAGETVGDACRRAVAAAAAAADQTSALLPRIGRARPHAEHSLGTPDPGAVSLALVGRAVVEALLPELKQEGVGGRGAGA
jgi:dihydroxyacetone kinase